MSRKAAARELPILRLSIFRTHRNPKKRIAGTPLSRCLESDDSAFQPDSNGVGPIVGAQFGEKVLDVTFHGFFRDRELGRNLLLAFPPETSLRTPISRTDKASSVACSRRGKLSDEGRKRLALAMKKRWAAAKKAGKQRLA